MAMENLSPESIGSLVVGFLDAAQAVVAGADPATPQLRPAELTHELDQVVSHFLDDHQLSAEHHEALQQEVLNSIAQHLVDEGARTDDGSDLFDPDGNAGLVDVLSLLDQHVGHGLASDPEPFTTPGSDAHHSS